MDLFNRAARAAKEVGNSVVSVGNAIGNATREQTELANLRIQKSAMEKRLEGQYAEIGKRYITYISNSYNEQPFDVGDILEQIQPGVDKIMEIEAQIAQKEQQIKESNTERDRKKAREQYDTEKKKLDKAMELDVISEEEYNTKLGAAQKRLDNFEAIHKVEMQYQLDIISREEYEEKIQIILQ